MKNAFLCTLVVMILLAIHGQAYGHADGKCISVGGTVKTVSHISPKDDYVHAHKSTSKEDGSNTYSYWTQDAYDLALARMDGTVTDEDDTYDPLVDYYDCYSVTATTGDPTDHKVLEEGEVLETYKNTHQHLFSHQHGSDKSSHSHYVTHYNDDGHDSITSHDNRELLELSGHDVVDNDTPITEIENTPTPTTQPNTNKHSWQPPKVSDETVDTPTDEPDTTPEPVKETKKEVKIPEPPEPPPPVIPKQYAEFQFYKGINFFSMPLYLDGINTIADLWNKYQFLQLNGLIYVLVDNCWLTYNGQEDQVAGDIPLTPYTALALSLISPSLVGMRGVPYVLQETLELAIGANFVAFPILPTGVVRPSDLIALGATAVLVSIKGVPYLIGRAGDPGDDPISPNHGMLVVTQNPIVLEFAIVAAAPAAIKKKTLITSWAKQKMKE